MSRPAPGVGSVGEALARLAGEGRPAWVSPRSWRLAGALVASLRADVEALDDGPTATAAALGVSRSTLALWRGPGGWLADP